MVYSILKPPQVNEHEGEGRLDAPFSVVQRGRLFPILQGVGFRIAPSSPVLESIFETNKTKKAVQLQTVDHSARRSMKNGASSDKRCELQDTPNTWFSNAHCGYGVSRSLVCLRVGWLINYNAGLLDETTFIVLDLSSDIGLPESLLSCLLLSK